MCKDDFLYFGVSGRRRERAIVRVFRVFFSSTIPSLSPQIFAVAVYKAQTWDYFGAEAMMGEAKESGEGGKGGSPYVCQSVMLTGVENPKKISPIIIDFCSLMRHQ